MEVRHITIANLEGTDAADTKYGMSPFEGRVRITEARIMPHVTVAANDTNYITVALDGANGSTEIFADRATTIAGGALTAGTAASMTITAAGVQQAELDQGDSVKVTVSKSGTGPTYDFDVILTVEPINK